MKQLPVHLRLQRANGRAPHKPVFLLALLRAFDEGLVDSNRFEISAELINLFKGYWQALVTEPVFRERFFLPYYHLSTERSGIWHLHKLPGWENALTKSNSPKSLGALVAYMPWGQLHPPVFQRWLDTDARAVDRALLMSHYFPGLHVPEQLTDALRAIEEQITSLDPEAYRAKQFEQPMDAEEEEQILRSAAFKRKIPELYGHRCAITGLQVVSKSRTQLIDACHIVPWAESYDDTVTNGIALSPTLHRAFDRGLIAISPEFRVLVTHDLHEGDSAHAIKPLAGRVLFLPAAPRHHPSHENLAQHRVRHGFAA
ncbi:MAG TPA: HNH endonuclease [Flavobacteriales bacterium]|nr:HNH endonuclease [Flavobacteriales bacterium]